MPEKPKVSVLMPTYNDEKYITTAIESLQKQSYRNWELIIIDGSNDTTPDIIKQLAEKDRRIKHSREQRSGQLNALLYGSQFVQGKYVTLLHSDDELLGDKAFELNVTALEENKCDGIYSDLVSMDASGQISGKTKTVNTLYASSPATLLLRAGSNLVPDFFFVTKEAFSNVISSYITWNMPYWLRFDETNVGILELKKIDPWYKYRIYGENYIRSEVGRFETVNGCLRTVLEISQRIDLPFLKLQRLLARVLKTRTKPLSKHKPSSPQRIRDTLLYTLNSYLKEPPENIYFRGLIGFYSNFPSTRTTKLEFNEDADIFLGKDARLFFNLMQKKSLPEVYEYILEEASRGFGKVITNDEESLKKGRNVMKFLNLVSPVEIG
jgi:glycosyltransferase involved in cell wall biosynthesis